MMKQDALVEILDSMTELSALCTAAATITERVCLLIAEYSGGDLGDNGRNRSHNYQPIVDVTTFSVKWRGKQCDLGASIPFRLMQRFSRRSNQYFTYDILMEEVWNRQCANSTIRSAIKRLRRALCAAGMDDLATAIKGRGECYGLFLNGDGF
jgi:DNA-binding response OmpR family regulator